MDMTGVKFKALFNLFTVNSIRSVFTGTNNANMHRIRLNGSNSGPKTSSHCGRMSLSMPPDGRPYRRTTKCLGDENDHTEKKHCRDVPVTGPPIHPFLSSHGSSIGE